MQQKALKYILIGGVLFIWGLIIYKIIDATGEEVIPLQATVSYPAKNTEYEKFTLIADYPDPFLPDTTSLYDSVNAQKKNLSLPVLQVEAPKQDVSFIEYHGMINNPLKKIKIALVKLNGKEMLIKEKEEIGELKIKKIKKDFLSIRFKNRDYQIRKD